MKKKAFITAIAAIVLLFSFNIQLIAGNINIKGSVISSGKGIGNVMITDGKNVVSTDEKGNYKMITTTESDFIYYSLPKGYNSPVMDGVPVFYSTLQKDKKEQIVNFEIYKSLSRFIKNASYG